MKNCVTIQLKKDEIWIKIDEDAEEKQIVECLKKKLVDLKKLYKNEKTPIKVVGKVLKNKEIDEIQQIIKEEIKVDVDFESPKVLGLYEIKKAFSRQIESSETKFSRGSLRSGQRIEEDGSIVILGDVNSGAEVIASDNIIVLGTLRGLAHAGAKGNKEALVAASEFDAVQVRIANIVKEIDKDVDMAKKHVYIHVVDDKIIVEKC